MARILLVEDEENLQLLYRQELEADGHEVLCASDGKSAARMALEAQPDVVIMDINLPQNMDGMESMSKILSQNREIPVIINTGYSEYKDNFMSWAADAYILKSADMGPLKDAIRSALDSRNTSAPEQ